MYRNNIITGHNCGKKIMKLLLENSYIDFLLLNFIFLYNSKQANQPDWFFKSKHSNNLSVTFYF